MSIPELIGIATGFLVEIAWLLHRGDDIIALLPNIVRPDWPLWFQSLLNRYQLWLWALLLVSAAYIFEQLPFGTNVYFWLDPALTVLAVGMLLVVLYYGVLGDGMLPRVNLQKILVVHIVVVLTLWVDGDDSWPAWMAWLLLAGTIPLVWQAYWPRPLTLTTAALIYFWYLLTLLVLTILNLNEGYFTAYSLNAFEIFIFAVSFVFLSLHVLLTLRFLVIVLSLILPRNRPLLQLIIPRLLQPDAMPRRQVSLFILFALIVISLNEIADLTVSLAFSNLIILAVVQFDGAERIVQRENEAPTAI